MPGVPYSKACDLCKKRRVKCDEKKPACSQCIRLGKPCPGFRQEIRIVDEGAKLRKTREKLAKGVVVVTSGPNHELTTVPSPATTGLTYNFFPPIASTEVAQRGFELLLWTHLPVMHTGRFRYVLNADLDPAAMAETFKSRELVPSFMPYIPQRLGHNQALDSAVDAIFNAASLVSQPKGTDKRYHALLRKYTLALAHLREAIRDPVLSLSAETLAAVSLLGSYECLHTTHVAAWKHHQQGIYQLLEARGPDRYKTDFEKQLLIAAIGSVFTVALRNNHPCFLEEPAWQELIYSKPQDSILTDEWSDTWTVLPLMCLIPRLMTECRDIVRNQHKITDNSQFVSRIEKLAAATESLRHQFLNLGDRYGWEAGRYLPVLAPRRPGDSYRVFHDRDDARSSQFANYLSSILIINRILIAVRPSMDWLEAKNRSFALEIQYIHSFLRSHPQLREIYLVYPERIALSVLLTNGYWSVSREATSAPAHDPAVQDGGKLIDEWKWNIFDDILCASKVDAPLLLHYDQQMEENPSQDFWK